MKLFLRELPEPLLPHFTHKDLVAAVSTNCDNTISRLKDIIKTLDTIESDTLEFIVYHLAKVAEADNKMDVENLATLFGQVLLWPDINTPLDFKQLAGEFNIKFNKYQCYSICYYRGCQKCQSGGGPYKIQQRIISKFKKCSTCHIKMKTQV